MVDYGTSLGFTTSTLITLLLMVQFIAFPATLIYNWFAKQIGIKQAILIAIGGYICIAVIGSLVSKEWHFYIIAPLIGCFCEESKLSADHCIQELYRLIIQLSFLDFIIC